MSSHADVSFVRDEDLLDEPLPTTRAPRVRLGRRRRLSGAVLALVGLPLLTLLLVKTRGSLSLEGQVLLYLLAVVVIAGVGGITVALLSAVAAALLINYNFVAPLHTLDVAHADEALSLAMFVLVAAVVSGAVELAARRAHAAEQAMGQAETLSTLAGADLDESETLRDVLERARRTFKMQTVVLKRLNRAAGEWHEVERAGWPGQQPEPLRFDVPIGDLRLVGRGPALFAEDRRVLHAFAAAAQTAFEGRQLTEQVREGRNLAVADRQRTALLAAVGHDLRTPLAGIKAAVTSLRQPDVSWSEADRDELLATIDQSADRLDGIVTNLLDASRLQAGALAVQIQAMALDEVVGAAVLAVPEAAKRVDVDVPDDLPLLRVDPGLLERVFVNLIDNALRYGGPQRVQITARAGAGSAKVEILDHGSGVPAGERERLFEPFQRLDDRSAVSGVGLGLSVARGFVEAMGGALAADRGPDGGLLMRLRLPLAGAATSAGGTPTTATVGSEPAGGLQP
ncbi:MAG TPA: ATP-binding protein [Solirubrobacteraceae bacterium]